MLQACQCFVVELGSPVLQQDNRDGLDSTEIFGILCSGDCMALWNKGIQLSSSLAVPKRALKTTPWPAPFQHLEQHLIGNTCARHKCAPSTTCTTTTPCLHLAQRTKQLSNNKLGTQSQSNALQPPNLTKGIWKNTKSTAHPPNQHQRTNRGTNCWQQDSDTKTQPRTPNPNCHCSCPNATPVSYTHSYQF